jgi:arginyl-tRNA synthetase
MGIKNKIQDIIKKAFKEAFLFEAGDVEVINPDPRFGDFAVSCHKFSKDIKKSPEEIAQKLSEFIDHDFIISVSPVSGYLNIFVDCGNIASVVLPEVIDKGREYGSFFNSEEKIMLEYSSPNTNKPLHLGHARNNVLGMSIAKLLELGGSTVIKSQVINDRGIHIIKSMIAYKKWGNSQTPEEKGEKGDHFVGRFYVMFEKEFEREWQEWLSGNPEVLNLLKEDREKRKQEFFSSSLIGKEAQEMLRVWEAGDESVLKLWKKMNGWVYSGFLETYKRIESEFDKEYYESETYLFGKEIIEKGIKEEVFYKQTDNSVWADLTSDGLDKKILQRKDGTSVYLTQDLGLAVRRQKEVKFDGMIYIVGHEQEYHFKVLFSILKKLGYKWAKKLFHLSYGLVFLPEGKMKSREGKVVDADDIIKEVCDLAFLEVKKRFPEILEEEALERANIIGIGALKFFLLRVNPTQPIIYNPIEAISFEGSTGPYVQYAHARISSILLEETPLSPEKTNLKELREQEEKELILKILSYPEIVKHASQFRNPSMVCTYLVELAHSFNSFYHKHKILRAESEEIKMARLVLIKSVQIVLRNGLLVLGIKAPDKM